MVVSKRFAEQSIADTLTPLLEFNGKSVVENGNDFYVASVPALPDEPSYDYSELNAALLDFRPHVVIAITREEFVYKILPPVESAWDSVAEGQARPFYVVPTALSGNLDLLEYVSEDSSGASSESKRQRIVGVAPASAEDTTLYNQFLIRFRSAFPRFENPGGFENFYDAVYLLANAMFAAGSVPELRGPDVARGMQRVIDGRVEISVGPTFIADGFTALAAGGEIRLLGTMGPADFDPGVGARRGNASVYCIERSESEGGLAFAYDVLRYDGEADLAGNFPVFRDFEGGSKSMDAAEHHPMESAEMLQPGDAVGRYQLLCPIARGGMGVVWAARQTGRLGLPGLVAIKIALRSGHRVQDYLFDEAKVAAAIDHPNVCKIFELGQEERAYSSPWSGSTACRWRTC